MKKIYLYIILAIAVFGATGYFFIKNNSAKEIKYRTEKIGYGNVVVQVRATGTVNPVTTVQVGSQVSGTISKIYVDFNSIVREGQIIAQIDSTFLSASVKEAEANIERAQAQVNEAKRNLDRMKELFNKNLVSQAEMDASQASYETSLAQLKQSQAALNRAEVNLQYSTIRAPISGIVISRDVDVGQTVAASLQAPKLFTIAKDLKQMQVSANVDEADIGNIKAGQLVTFTVDAYPAREFKGAVSQIRLAPQVVQNVVTYTVIIDVPNPDLKLMPGMTATVSILVDKRENVLRVPLLALRFQPPKEALKKFQKTEKGSKDDETGELPSREKTKEKKLPEGISVRGGSTSGRKVKFETRGATKTDKIWILENNQLKPAGVSLGLSDNRYIEIIDGQLKEGDEIVIGIMNNEMIGGRQQQQSNPFMPRMPGGGGRSRF
jgi:HlyD family secretion protein